MTNPLKFKQLISFQGEVDRTTYLLWGILLFVLKYNLDKGIASWFGRDWFITDYFIHANPLSLNNLGEQHQQLYIALLLLAIPFIWFGTLLCIKRLRNANLPIWLVLFFFLPFVNLLLFILLAAVPSKVGTPVVELTFMDRLIPRSRTGSALFAIGVVVVSGLALSALFVNVLGEYGWSLFVGVPFLLGFASVLFYAHHHKMAYRQALGVALLTVLIFNGIIFLLAFEGILCIAMAFPIMVFVAIIGATIAYAIQDRPEGFSFNLLFWPVIFVPLFGSFEAQYLPQAPIIQVTSMVTVNAPPQKVWDQLVAFSTIEEPREWLFKTGIAYPTHAQIEGRGIGAIRKCHFTTGAFIEPITHWKEPHLLQFSVLQQPPPMVEWTFYDHLELAHLDGYFKSLKGQFQLREVAAGQTVLEGTTWYRHEIWPNGYWQLWSDYILHQIHMRVLNHIKKEAEKT